MLQRVGSSTRADLRELFRRIIFNVLVSNTDDHLRNHGFLYAGRGGWTLSPAYDLNPVPAELKSRFLSTAIGEDPNDTSASLELAMEVHRVDHAHGARERDTRPAIAIKARQQIHLATSYLEELRFRGADARIAGQVEREMLPCVHRIGVVFLRKLRDR